jgi:hypothetical protein
MLQQTNSTYRQEREKRTYTKNNTIQKFVKLYLQVINETPNQPCSIYDMLHFHHNIHKFYIPLVEAFSLVLPQTFKGIIAVGHLIFKQCIKSIVDGKISYFVMLLQE